MKKHLKVLVVEDSEFDSQVMYSVLRQGGYNVHGQRVENASAFREALGRSDWDVILSDYNLPDFQAPDALHILKATDKDIPFIIISGGIGEDVAVAAMKSGAHDYLMKGQLARLVVAVEREMREAQVRRERRQVEAALRESELRNRLLWENSTDAVIFMDQEGLIHFANPAATRTFGYSNSDLVGGKMDRLFLEPGLDEMRRRTRQIEVTQGSSLLRESLLLIEGHNRRGDLIPLEIATSSIELHQSLMLVAFIRDISERLQAEYELQHHKEQLRVAREIQQWMFPKEPPKCPGIDIAGDSFPAEEAGGDYYDYLNLPGGLIGLVVADVTGHGIGPALLMAEARAYLRVLARPARDVGDILTRANTALQADLGMERYITMLLVAIDIRNKRLSWSSAGHAGGCVIGRDGEVRFPLERTGPPLGIRAESAYREHSEALLQPGDIVVLLTDGFEEAISESEELYGTERIHRLIHRNRHQSSREILVALRDEVRRFVGPGNQEDDLTGIIARVDPAG